MASKKFEENFYAIAEWFQLKPLDQTAIDEVDDR